MFKGALSYLKEEQLKAILPSYGFEDSTLFEKKYKDWLESPMPYWSISQLVDALKIPNTSGIAVEKSVKEKLKQQTEAAVKDAQQMVTLYRGDNRDLNTIRIAGGFYGLNDGNITVEHARIHINDINNLDWFQSWVNQTAGATDKIPYVATGKSNSHKGGHEYRIQLPLQGLEQSAKVKPIIVTDTNNLATARIIALYMREEVLLLTGIPIGCITQIK